MAKKGLKGHIALWTLGRYSDDPRVHDFLNTMMYYSGGKIGIHWIVHRQAGLAMFARAVIGAPFGYGKHLAPSRGIRMLSKHGEYPIRYEYTKPSRPVRSTGPATPGVARGVAARTVLPFLLGGVLVNRMYSLNMFRSESIVH